MIKNTNETPYRPFIFVAEDVPKNLHVLYDMLNRENYRVAASGNGEQALKMIADLKPDLVLLDIMMPGINGIEVCRRLKENPATAEIPIIFLTALANPDDIVKGFKIGAVDYITKPFNQTELMARVKNHLELRFSREALKELNTTKDKFLSIISHDLRTPLQSLYFSTYAAYQKCETLDEEEKKDHFRHFYHCTHQLSMLVENLFYWARSQGGGMEARPDKLDMAGLAKETLELLEESSLNKKIRLNSLIETGITAYADRDMIRTVMRNLVSNAVKYTKPGGEVTLRAEIRKGSTAIKVEDNGMGMDEKTIAQLFVNAGKRITPGTADEKGSGLGLILCKEFVEKNHGTIDVESEPGKGTVFTFTMPEVPDI
ncbi:MAG: hybrid sensor histidine kinase/response regulator [bacterium]|nr:hybrid sensor histidine kinase/response regulator [bacterium]